MFSIFFLIALMAIVYIVYWAVKNDGAPTPGDETGLLRMRAVDEPSADRDDKPRSLPPRRPTRPGAGGVGHP
ncbi:hypothetical protein F11_16050 [Rhodospirillum rubrum F11]|uniref:Uncharacterized protein n=1 Tax=Rhodospirillum rubrum (strain ATCC 11170 / ATH 1.1.1 / DSM 467 / LMG 4362 / NCIMB 8255 / S1) TaxID=269796 RepID=Q2RPL7_RHORT|nr:hypothetical protein [Rhodospirillum rubrum]ABC23928.1 hypothetical protein Rru_A3133 [Rhodospirillum rubrum ATCC 11170]AEO49672.1 hypothetical protein F11_16050 [Rhodospirillum rubrum F11]MBK5955626.1 hypothetical protein [Rhodospirillum rubrum]QXG79872.1 hypothetical protein KUL73_16150 [Rhodospirillum rubrum]